MIWAVLASGPSLTKEQIELVRQSGVKTIAVNSTWESVRFCDVIYGGDFAWWRYNDKHINIDAERWTCSKNAMVNYRCQYRPRQVKPGFNSGANAVELAVNHFNAELVIMLGFDCSVKNGVHHHGKHPKTSNPEEDKCERWKPQFKSLKNVTKVTPVYNCSSYSEIKYFPKRDLRELLCELGLI